MYRTTTTSNGYFLDPSSAKFECPECRENTFVRYVNSQGNYLPSYVGRCDREMKCGCHNKASQYFIENNIDLTQLPNEVIQRPTEFYKIRYSTIHAGQEILTDTKRNDYVDLSTCDNNFIRYLIDVLKFSPEQILAHLLKYNVFIHNAVKKDGENDFQTIELYNSYCRHIKNINQKVQYFYVSASNEVRTAREIHYKPDFHRDKESEKLLHIELTEYDKNKRVKMCIWGEHLLAKSNHNDIIVVEGEKTAFVMSLYYPEYTWLAVGGVYGISSDFDFIKPDVRYYFIPDADIDVKGFTCADKWRKKIPQTIYNQTDYKVIDFEKYCNLSEIYAGFDILDLQLKDPERSKQLIKSVCHLI
jgi:hypothetical protein